MNDLGALNEALDAQLDEVTSTLRGLSPADWGRPTRCPPLTVAGLVGHLGRVLHRYAEELRAPRDDAVNCDRYRYWDPDPGRDERVVREAVEHSSGRPSADLLDWFGDGAAAALRATRGVAPGKPCVRGGRVLTATEFAATRVLEAGVHGMDIGHATLRGEVIHPLAADVVVDVLATRLGAALPASVGWDARTFVLTGTGRRRLEPNERVSLAGLAERFPMVS